MAEPWRPGSGEAVGSIVSPGGWLPMWRVAGAVFIAYPVVRIVLDPPPPLIALAALAVTALFTLLLVAVGRRSPDDARRANPALAIVDLVILGLAAWIVANSPDQGWVGLFYFGSTAASMLLPERRAIVLIIASGVICGFALVVSQDPGSAAIQGLAVSIIGITVFAMSALRRTNQQLHAAREELATLAVTAERDRIARDLHDVLGHSLSLIAIKSELAGRLLPGDPERARAEIGDVERVARESLASVRDTVSGSRQPTLERELANARLVLEAAGIEPTIDTSAGPLPEAEDAVLAWAVREAVTNVVRHSAAHSAAIRTCRVGDEAAIEVVDDGRASTSAGGPELGGTGLRGLRERLESVGGRLDAGPRPDGGYRLEAIVPVRVAAEPRGAGAGPG